ncbi:hypothetical protein HG530_008753 [Fusarium avenaceum]|nr:hypothetical protein HG530_008753 [Fusarium avenaceum]
MFSMAGEISLPEKVTDEMVFADVVREVVHAGREVLVLGYLRVQYGVGRYANRVDGAVELGMRGRHKHLVKAPTALRHNLRVIMRILVSQIGIDQVNNNGQLVDKLAWLGATTNLVAHKLIDHAAQNSFSHPNVAVHNPYNISLGFPGVVLLLEHDTRIDRREIVDNLLEDRKRWIGIIFETQSDGDLVLGVILSKRRSDAIVKPGLNALDGSNYRNVRCILPKIGGHWQIRATVEVAKACGH